MFQPVIVVERKSNWKQCIMFGRERLAVLVCKSIFINCPTVLDPDTNTLSILHSRPFQIIKSHDSMQL
jgi:hypothetical protein